MAVLVTDVSDVPYSEHGMRHVASLPAYCVGRLLGKTHGLSGEEIRASDCYFWGHAYYRLDALDFDVERNTLTMPDGLTFPGGFVLPIYRAI